jgi:hypothetical protein
MFGHRVGMRTGDIDPFLRWHWRTPPFRTISLYAYLASVFARAPWVR